MVGWPVVVDMERRTYVQMVGGAAFAAATAISGCLGGDGGGEEGLDPDDYPALDEWLTETEVGGADDTYDGAIVDERGSDPLIVDVGASGNGGNFAFAPSAVAVTPGTVVRWVWTGEGGLHNVEAEPDEQIGESDYEFSSGEPVDEEGHEFERTLEETGLALYHCEPHLAVGMKGAVVVTE